MLLLFEKLFAERHSRSHKFCDSSLDDLLGQLRILELITNCDLVSGSDESWQIGLQRMMRESCHRNSTRSRTGTLCKHDSQNLACGQGIVSIGFIKITAPEQKHSLRVLRLHGEVLLHHRCFGSLLLCHISFFFLHFISTRHSRVQPSKFTEYFLYL